jgi:polysaccharide chain length determinant protein (PEP-CTERM system associated)
MTGAQDSFNLSGLEYYSLHDYARMFFHRTWFIIIATLSVAALTATVVHFLPDHYQAKTLILVDRQKVPDYYVNSTVIGSAADRLDTLRQEVLSTARLAQVIDEMGLYKELKNKETQDEIVDLMRKDISVTVAATSQEKKGLEAFTVAYSNSNPVLAAQVTNRLASLLIEDNIKNREQSVLGTADFLQKELEDARQSLKTSEDKITGLKRRNASVLPESATGHVQALTSLQLELQNDRDKVSQGEQQKIYLQSLLANSPAVVNLDTQRSPENSSIEDQKAQLENEVDQLRQRYGPSYPEILKKNNQIRALEAQLEESNKAEPNAPPAPAKERNPVVQSQIAKLDEEIQERKADERKIEAQIDQHQAELARIPIFEQQVSSVMRDYEAAQDHYKRLADRKFSADMATDMEIRQKGERFEILDPAQVPYKPTSPDRPILDLIGLAGGLAFGFVGALALEILDLSVKTEQEVINQLGAPVFGDVPWFPTPVANRRRRLQTILACAGSALLAGIYSFLLLGWRLPIGHQ